MVGDKGKRYIILGMKQINFHSIIGNRINQYKHTTYKAHFIDIIKLLKHILNNTIILEFLVELL